MERPRSPYTSKIGSVVVRRNFDPSQLLQIFPNPLRWASVHPPVARFRYASYLRCDPEATGGLFAPPKASYIA